MVPHRLLRAVGSCRFAARSRPRWPAWVSCWSWGDRLSAAATLDSTAAVSDAVSAGRRDRQLLARRVEARFLGRRRRVDAKAKNDEPTVWVKRDRDQPENFRVLSPLCPHQGCIVKWRADRSLFVCPCHGGTFDAEGNRKSGPPQYSLAALDYQVKDGQLLFRWEDG